MLCFTLPWFVYCFTFKYPLVFYVLCFVQAHLICLMPFKSSITNSCFYHFIIVLDLHSGIAILKLLMTTFLALVFIKIMSLNMPI
jgi:hypothetical protein